MSVSPPSDRDRPPGGWWDDSLREFAPFLGLGIQLAAAVLIFFSIGWWIDTSYDTSPWGKLVGVLVGAAGGMIKFFRTVTGPEFQPPDKRDRHDVH